MAKRKIAHEYAEFLAHKNYQYDRWDLYSYEFAQFFWSRVAVTADATRCWEWKHGKYSQGYGRISVDGKEYATHRLAWQIANKREPQLWILHSCDNPKCCNPAHLREGTHAENTQDIIDRGRAHKPKGELNGQAKLSVMDVRQIKQLLQQGHALDVLAKRFRVSQSNIWCIKHGKTWSNVNF